MDFDTTGKKIVLNAIFLFSGTIFAKLSSFIFNIIISRYFGANGLGVFTLGVMTVSFAVTIALLGLQDGLINFVGRYDATERPEKLVGVILITFGIAGTLSLFLAGSIMIFPEVLAITVFDEPQLVDLLPIFAMAIPSMVIVRLAGATLHGINKSNFRVLIQQIIPKGGLLIVTLIVLSYALGIEVLVFVYTGTLLVGAIAGIGIVSRIVLSRFNGDFRGQPKKLLRFSLPLLFSGFVGMVLTWTDTFFIGYFLPTINVGQYRVAFLLGANIPIFRAALSGALYPNIAGSLANGDDQTVVNWYHRAQRWVIILTIAPAIYLMAFPKASIGSLFGAEFTVAAPALIAIVVGNAIGVIIGPATNTLKAVEKSRFILITNLLALGLNVVMNVLLIPQIGILGAALSTMGATIITNLLHYWEAKQKLSLNFNYRALFFTTSIAIFSAGTLKLLIADPESLITLPFHVLIYTVFYLLFTYRTGLITPTEVEAINKRLYGLFY